MRRGSWPVLHFRTLLKNQKYRVCSAHKSAACSALLRDAPNIKQVPKPKAPMFRTGRTLFPELEPELTPRANSSGHSYLGMCFEGT